METVSMTRKHDIVQESQKILSEMKHEIGALEGRVKMLEKENAEKNALKEQLAINRSLNNGLLMKMDEERTDQDKNMLVLSDLMDDLKDPVHDVVGNLTEWGASFQDEEIKNSFNECLNTAQKVLTSFNKVEDFCRSLKRVDINTVKSVDLRKSLKEILVNSFKEVINLKLFIDKSIPETISVNIDVLTNSLETIIRTLLKSENPQQQIMISVLKKGSEDSLQEGQIKLLVRVMSDKPTDMIWKEDWYEAVDITGERKDMLPLEWLESKNYLRSLNGNLYIISNDGQVVGSEIHLPLS